MADSEKVCGHWACDFLYQDPVIWIHHPKRLARVAKAAIKDVPPGHVPIFFEDRRNEQKGAFLTVPADDLNRR